ncbi:hypothetical protein OSTOST_13502 [Ostertagia ostertagi]
MQLVNGGKPKKPKCWERQGLASIEDFKMASGGEIVKEMKQVVIEESNSKDADGNSNAAAAVQNVEKYRNDILAIKGLHLPSMPRLWSKKLYK